MNRFCAASSTPGPGWGSVWWSIWTNRWWFYDMSWGFTPSKADPLNDSMLGNMPVAPLVHQPSMNHGFCMFFGSPLGWLNSYVSDPNLTSICLVGVSTSTFRCSISFICVGWYARLSSNIAIMLQVLMGIFQVKAIYHDIFQWLDHA